VLAAAIPDGERIAAIEHTPELRLAQPYAIALDAASGGWVAGRAELESAVDSGSAPGVRSLRELVDHALHMAPNRLVVDGFDGDETLEVLQAMSAGCEGSLATIHAHSPEDALRRLERLARAGDAEPPARAVRAQIAQSVQLVVQQTRFSDGSRKLSAISEVAGLDRDAKLRLRPLYEYVQTGLGARGEIQGRFEPTGYLPSFLPELLALGLVKRGEHFL
jgi:pilus assembly protein CpaF